MGLGHIGPNTARQDLVAATRVPVLCRKHRTPTLWVEKGFEGWRGNGRQFNCNNYLKDVGSLKAGPGV